MNDHDAMGHINLILDRWFRGEINETATLAGITHVTGQNAMEHAEAKRVAS